MKKEEIHLWDIKRILFGQAPAEFMLEVFVRSVIVYIIAIVVVRAMGKRMNGQHTIVELAVMVMMGAIVSLPMQAPDRGILQGVLVLLVTLLLLRGVNWLSYKNKRFETTVQGEPFTLIKDGVLQKDVQAKTGITNQNVFEVLRSKQIFNLAKVKRMYIEGCGIFSVYQEEEERPGLPVFLQIDKTIYEDFSHSADSLKACSNCGAVQDPKAVTCANCGNKHLVKAINVSEHEAGRD